MTVTAATSCSHGTGQATLDNDLTDLKQKKRKRITTAKRAAVKNLLSEALSDIYSRFPDLKLFSLFLFKSD